MDGIGTSLYASKDVGFFAIEMELKPESLAIAEEEVWVELDRIFRDPPAQAEMDRVRNIVESNFLMEKEDVLGQAHTLAYFESLGGWEKAQAYLERMRAVTAGDLMGAVERYLAFDRMSLLEYVPNSLGGGAPTEQRLESLKKRVAARTEKSGPRTAPKPAPPPEALVVAPVNLRFSHVKLQGSTEPIT